MAPTSQTAPVALRLTRTLAAPPHKVFRAWTDPQALKRWSAPGDMTTPLAEVDLRVGGRYRIHMLAPDGTVHKVSGVYRLVEPPAKLVYTWRWEEKPEEGDTLVTVEFHDRGGRTEVVLTHERFPNVAVRDRHESGWAGCLAKLATVVSEGSKA